jgi:hypothetical protein
MNLRGEARSQIRICQRCTASVIKEQDAGFGDIGYAGTFGTQNAAKSGMREDSGRGIRNSGRFEQGTAKIEVCGFTDERQSRVIKPQSRLIIQHQIGTFVAMKCLISSSGGRLRFNGGSCEMSMVRELNYPGGSNFGVFSEPSISRFSFSDTVRLHWIDYDGR